MARKKKDPDSVDELDFETAMTELETVVSDLDAGDVPLEESLAAFERGVRLVRHLHRRLDGVQRKIEELSLEGGEPVLSELSEDDED